jgi:imidazolonepropionase-like amidohydrolase
LQLNLTIPCCIQDARLLAGTDSPAQYCPPGFSLHQELEQLVEPGLTPAAALQAATIHGAMALKDEMVLGASFAGYWGQKHGG